MKTTLVIEGAPISWKNAKEPARNKRTGKTFIKTRDDAKAWMESATMQLRHQWRRTPTTNRDIKAHFDIYQAKGQSVDADNAMSGAFDALQHAGIISNDYQLSEGSWRRTRDRERPRIEITIEEL